MLFHLLRSRRTAIAESGHTRPNRRAPRFCVQITKLVTLGAHQPHDRDQDTARQPIDTAGVGRELRLHEDVSSGSLPRLEVAEKYSSKLLIDHGPSGVKRDSHPASKDFS